MFLIPDQVPGVRGRILNKWIRERSPGTSTLQLQLLGYVVTVKQRVIQTSVTSVNYRSPRPLFKLLVFDCWSCFACGRDGGRYVGSFNVLIAVKKFGECPGKYFPIKFNYVERGEDRKLKSGPLWISIRNVTERYRWQLISWNAVRQYFLSYRPDIYLTISEEIGVDGACTKVLANNYMSKPHNYFYILIFIGAYKVYREIYDSVAIFVCAPIK